jgi:glycosyltransferase involved in cell wall biosynthesis
VRVLIDTTFALRGPSGSGVYVNELSAALERAGVDVVEAANTRRRPPGGGGLKSVRNLVGDELWTQRLRRRPGDLVHHPLPAYVRGERRPQVVTVHDIAYELAPEDFDPRFVAYARRFYRRAALRADAVVCGTEATAKHLRARWGVKRVVVAPYGPGQTLDVRERGPARHFLYVGDAEPRKDLPTLLAAHARYRARATDPLPLVLAGSATAHQQGVHVRGQVTKEELAELHAHAAALVHPARHEGFGLTVAEALHAGTPVIAARSDAVAEVAGDAATLVAPGDVEGLARALERPPAAGRGDVPTWDACAQAHIQAYRLALST